MPFVKSDERFGGAFSYMGVPFGTSLGSDSDYALDIACAGMIWGNCLVGAWGHDYNSYENAAKG
jgi:hypothetical protein